MNVSTNTNSVMASALLATTIIATGVSLAATSYADGGAPASPVPATQLQSLVPTPANTRLTDGPTAIADNGIHMHFLVNGSATDVLGAYKTALKGKGWTVIVVSSDGWGGAGGATYTATKGSTYGVFGGGGNESGADVNACVWPSRPANPNCGGNQR